MKNLLLAIVFFLMIIFYFNITEFYEDNFLKEKNEKQKNIIDLIDNIIIYNNKCPADSDPIFSCTRTYENVGEKNCSNDVINKFLCDLSNNSYQNALYILRHFENLNNERINDLMNACYINQNLCIDNKNKCIKNLLTCLFDKTYFARHKIHDDFKTVYQRAYKDCISNAEIISNKYAFSCDNLI